MACRNFEGQLLRKKWTGWRKCWVRLRRGTVSVYDKRSELDEHAEMTVTKKSLHFHLDMATLTTAKKPNSIKLRLHSGDILKFRVSPSLGTSYVEEWKRSIREHIVYANRCMGISASVLGVAEPGSLLAALAKESKERMDLLQLSLLSFHIAVREANSRMSGGVTETLHDVTGAAERAQKAMREFYDAVLQENLFREEELTKSQDRAQLAEDTLEVVTKKYNSMLVNMDKSISGRSIASSSQYFTPEGSLRGFMDAYHSDDELSVDDTTRGQPESLVFEKDDVLMARTKVRDDIERVLRGLDAAAKRRETPRLASFGPMSVAGSSYNDLLSVVGSDRFEDCISDTRSFVVSNGHLSALGSETTKSSHYTDARSSFASDAQSFKSAVSGIRSA